MEKKEKKETKRSKVKVEKNKNVEDDEKPVGFPEDVDFKKFLGCGG